MEDLFCISLAVVFYALSYALIIAFDVLLRSSER